MKDEAEEDASEDEIVNELDTVLQDLGDTVIPAPPPAPPAPEVPETIRRPPRTSVPLTDAGLRPLESPIGSAVPVSGAAPVAKSEPPKPEVPPPPKPVEPPAPSSASPPVPKPAPSPKPPPLDPTPVPIALEEEGDLPEKIPGEQVRRLAFLSSAAQRPLLAEFVKFVDGFTRKALKKPIYLRKVLVEEVSDRSDPGAVLGRAKAAGAVAVLALISGLPEARVREFEREFAQSGLFYQVVPPGEALKRSFALDLSTQLNLLSPET